MKRCRKYKSETLRTKPHIEPGPKVGPKPLAQRTELATRVGETDRFMAMFMKLGQFHEQACISAMLMHVLDSRRRYVADHIWIQNGCDFLGLRSGDVIEFTGTIRSYIKRERGWEYKEFKIGGIKDIKEVLPYREIPPYLFPEW